MKPISFVMFIAVAIIISCGSLKKDANTEVQEFINEFAKSLKESDDIILSKFSSVQSHESILAGIRVLQNTDLKYVVCAPAFDNPLISFENEGIRVKIPIALTVDSLPDRRVDDSLVLWLAKTKDSFSITQFDGESFFNNYVSLRNAIDFERNHEAVLASRLEYYNKARELQQNYDSVIWYTNYNGNTYFYAVKGAWVNYFLNDRNATAHGNTLMALVDGSGKEIVPLEFDLIGTPGIAMEDVVEVKKNGLVGYYKLSTGENIVAPLYEWIIPASEQLKFILVRKGSSIGWLDDRYQFHAGFPSIEAEKYFKNFDFLPTDFTIDASSQTMCEIPAVELAGSGIVTPPSYMTSLGLFSEIMGGFVIPTDEAGDYYNASRQYVISNSNFFEKVTDKIGTILTVFKERYTEGREEFYTSKKITFLNEENQSIGTEYFSGAGEISFRKVDSALFEVKVIPTGEGNEGYATEGDEEWEIPDYRYFTINNDNTITLAKSNRRFAFTESVKLDSSYFRGEFHFYNEEQNKEIVNDFLSKETITSIRNEILASYGYTFTDPESSDYFKYREWYKPVYTSYSQFSDSMTEIDKYNLAFLERMVGTLDPSYSASL
ncbi:hypothetical protein BH09BAC3_BH09BAC3_18200 [soil metagenome]